MKTSQNSQTSHLDTYRLEALLGQGGMGKVYRAWDEKRQRPVAIKHLLTDSSKLGQEQARARFRREAKLVGRLNHPAVVRIYDFLERDDGDWLVMELVEGPTLRQLVQDGPLSVRLAVEYARQVAEGLAAAHAEGIVHRDLKTENVMILPSGEIRILDFGLAKELHHSAGESLQISGSMLPELTRTGQIMGTPRTMSPEQARGEKVDFHSDLFSLGTLLYELLSARSPFQGASLYGTLHRVVAHEQPALRRLVPQIPKPLSDLVDQLLEKNPARRPAGAAAVAESLHALTLTTPFQSAEEIMIRTLLFFDPPEDPAVEALCDRWLEKYEGLRIDRRTLLFQRPWNAVRFALSLREEAALREDEGEDVAQPGVAIHLGEIRLYRNSPQAVERGAKALDIEGPAKTSAMRLARLTTGGRILLTRAAYEVARLAADRLDTLREEGKEEGKSKKHPEEAAPSIWSEHGRYLFQGMEESLEIFEVGAVRPDLLPADDSGVWRPASPAPLGSESLTAPPDAAPTRLRRFPPQALPALPYPVLLPVAHPSFLAGRERELSKLRRVLRQPQLIVLLSAPSGTGKSSLLLAGLLPALRQDRRPAALSRHPQEIGLAKQLTEDLLQGGESPAEGDRKAFLHRLEEAERLSGEASVLILDQFEEVLRSPASRARVGTLLATTALRRTGIDTPVCRWVLAVRKESQGEAMVWLRDVLADAREQGEDVSMLPHNLSQPERLLTVGLQPFASVRSGPDALDAATRVFQEAITKPLALRDGDGHPRYPWHFAPGHAERLAGAFAAARIARPQAPLGPKLQVVLAYLLGRSTGEIEVPEEPGGMIETALEDHVRRALERAFPSPEPVRRARALLALHKLATAGDQHDTGLSARQIRAAIGEDSMDDREGESGEDILAKLSSPLTRLIVETEAPEGVRYALSHQRLAQVVKKLVEEEGRRGGLLVDGELLALRRVVDLKSTLYQSGETVQATRLPRRQFQSVAAHADALLWDDPGRAWWTACKKRRFTDRMRLLAGSVAILFLFLFASFGALRISQNLEERRALMEQVAHGAPEEVFKALDLLRQGGVPDDVLLAELDKQEHLGTAVAAGLGGLPQERRSLAVLATVEMLLPQVDAEDFSLLASLVWMLDTGPGRDPVYAERAQELRDRVLAPLREERPPPELQESDWVALPGGSFFMGSSEDGQDDERPRHEVTLSGFRIQRFEVTSQDFRRLVPEHPGEDGFPAAGMNWYEAATYAAWIGGRLPTEAEWEYAARAGCVFSFCDRQGRETTIDAVAWYRANSEEKPHPVGSLEPNAWELHDMLGNLWEWTAPWYDDEYPKDPQQDPWGPLSGEWRSIRGGSYRDTADRIRPANRSRGAPENSDALLGFRVVLLSPPAGEGTKN